MEAILFQVAGFGLVPYIRKIVKDLNLSGWYALIASTVLAVILNTAIAFIIGNPLAVGAALGVIVGLLTNVYNDSKEIQ